MQIIFEVYGENYNFYKVKEIVKTVRMLQYLISVAVFISRIFLSGRLIYKSKMVHQETLQYMLVCKIRTAA
jgi:hypothetical protein